MSLLSKRIAVKEIIVSDKGRVTDLKDTIFELEKNSMSVREIKTLHTTVQAKYLYSEIEWEIYLSSEYGKTTGGSEAFAGYVLFGLAGALAGGMLGKGNDPWILELKHGDEIRIFMFNSKRDKDIMKKYLS